MTRPLVRRAIAHRGGAAAIEFALVAPMFLTLVCGTVELAHWAWGAAAARDLAARGARCIAVSPEDCGSALATLAQLAVDAPLISQNAAITFDKSACGVRVIVTGGFPAVLTPGLGPTTVMACAG
jgi:Flp pilus assembly protein TadG